MTIEYNVLAPGPVNLHPRVQEALSRPMIHHRTPEFDRILAGVHKKLKTLFQTSEPVFVLSSTGSGGMEALLVNTMNQGDQILGIDSGKFGERWCEMAQVYGAQVQTMKLPWGEPVKVSAVQDHLTKNPQIKIVLCQACETSSGVIHPIEALGKMINEKFPETLFLVDGITALGAMPLPMDDWKIDGLVGGSQKAFMLPTGLSLVAFSKKAWKKVEQNNTPRFYFDLRKELKANQKGETFFSSNVTLIRALDVVLDLIFEKGLDAHFAEIHQRAEFTRQFGQKMGMSLFAKAPSDSLTALNVPAGIDSQKIRTELEKKHHITVMGGQDQARGKILRIGHMGYIQPEQMVDLMMKLGQTLHAEDPSLCPPGLMNKLETEMKKFWGLV
ncbi:MAG: alanine--glyoxylate aminotransferase family protein [Bdellovibrio sp. CG10_big_fil_rev_8_21_14_0_10_47_8]|nr:MAG: alanine--glyoxylate aminotransferase family protein [Bdellovibrio sp. CG10_big_fil_rev_8_21_14_0_10_47_8]